MPQGTMKSRNPLLRSAPEGLKYAVEPDEEKSYLDKLIADESSEDEKEYRETYFGYEEVPKEEKKSKLQNPNKNFKDENLNSNFKLKNSF